MTKSLSDAVDGDEALLLDPDFGHHLVAEYNCGQHHMARGTLGPVKRGVGVGPGVAVPARLTKPHPTVPESHAGPDSEQYRYRKV